MKKECLAFAGSFDPYFSLSNVTSTHSIIAVVENMRPMIVAPIAIKAMLVMTCLVVAKI